MTSNKLGPLGPVETVGTLAASAYEQQEAIRGVREQATALTKERERLEDELRRTRVRLYQAVREATDSPKRGGVGWTGFTLVEGNEVYFVNVSNNGATTVMKPEHIGEW